MYKDAYSNTRNNLGKLEGCYKRNILPINMNESTAHITKKFEVCLELRKLGYDFICECRFRGFLGRPDIYLPSEDIAIEILDSEITLKASKLLKYPVKKIVSISVNEIYDDLSKKL